MNNRWNARIYFTLVIVLSIIASCRPISNPHSQGIEGQVQNPGPLPIESPAETPPPDPADLLGKEITFTTDDGFQISGTLYHANAPKGVILLHMLGKNRSVYDPIIPDLVAKYAVLAIDFRGHGKSQGNLPSFEEKDFKAMIKDVAGARKLLGNKGIAIMGASIGANAGLVYSRSDPLIKTAILLSPGLEYRGIAISESMKSFNRPVLLVSSKGDAYSFQSVQTLAKANPGASAEYADGDAHGTDMFSAGTIIKVHVLNWLKANLGG